MIIVRIAPYWNWNSTWRYYSHLRWLVRIAPYWNWNINWVAPWIPFDMFELHLTGIETSILSVEKSGLHPFELHLTGIETTTTEGTCGHESGSNCTLLELKHRRKIFLAKPQAVRIAPYWNWNLETPRRTGGHSLVRIAPYWNWNYASAAKLLNYIRFELHLTGIETNITSNRHSRNHLFELHLTGIET